MRATLPAVPDPVVIAVDAGTTGVRAVAVDSAGRPARAAYRPLTRQFPQPGWVEQDPDDIWDAVEATMAEVRAGLEAPVAAIGVASQRETVVAWDRRTGEPLHPAI